MKKEGLFSTRSIVVIGLFAAICYVSLYFMVPIPSPVGKPFLHLGNLFLLLAALLFGGLQGGIAGSIGMGLFDLFNGYADTSLKTFLLKFLIGLIAGAIAQAGRKQGAKPVTGLIALLATVFLGGGAAALIAAVSTGGSIAIAGVEKPLTLPPVLYIFAIILGLLLAAAAILSKKLTIELQYAAIGATLGILFNLAGEFAFGVFYKTIAGSLLTPAIIASLISLPATMINGTFSIVGALLLYMPLNKALVAGRIK